MISALFTLALSSISLTAAAPMEKKSASSDKVVNVKYSGDDSLCLTAADGIQYLGGLVGISKCAASDNTYAFTQEWKVNCDDFGPFSLGTTGYCLEHNPSPYNSYDKIVVAHCNATNTAQNFRYENYNIHGSDDFCVAINFTQITNETVIEPYGWPALHYYLEAKECDGTDSTQRFSLA